MKSLLINIKILHIYQYCTTTHYILFNLKLSYKIYTNSIFTPLLTLAIPLAHIKLSKSLMSGCASIYFLDRKGKIIIYRDFRGEIS